MSEWREHVRPLLAQLRLDPAREADIVEELTQHLDQRYEELRAGGAGDAEARRLAIDELREPDALAERMRPLRQARAVPPATPGGPPRGPFRDVWQDLRYAARMLRRQPGFTAAAVLTLGLGIGANTAVFSLVNATLFQRLPVADRARLVNAYRSGVGGVFPYPMYAALRDGNDVFEELAAWGGITASLHAGESAELVSGVIVTGNFFATLGVRAEHGRLISRADDVTPGAHPVAVISHDFWETRFGGRPDVVGREVRLNGHVFTIIGVTPAGFPGPQLGTVRQLYVPMMMQAVMRPPRAAYSGEMNPDLLTHRRNSWLFAVGRLKAGASATHAEAHLSTLATAYLRDADPSAKPIRIPLVSIDEDNAGLREQMRSAALLLGGVVGAVLLIACANIANLLLSRTAARRRELAVRLAVGASRARLVRQLLTESMLLSAIGGGVGLVLAWAVIQSWQATPSLAGELPFAMDVAIDRRVLLFTLALSMLSGLVFGVAPALKASRPGLVPALKDGAGEGDGRGRRFDLKNALVVAEVALSLLLLIAAGLFVRSLLSARAIDPGFDAGRLVSAPLNINLLRYTRAQGTQFYRQIVERVERLPGVESASLSRVAVMTGGGRVTSLHVEGREATDDRFMSEGGAATTSRTETNANVVSPRFFHTFGVPIVLGRDFGDDDREGRLQVVIVNEAMARMHFPGESPIGKRVSVEGVKGPWREIVGVVRDSAHRTLGELPLPVVYLPVAQSHETGMTLYVRTAVPPASLVAALRREIQSLEPHLPVPNIQTMQETIGTSLFAARMGAWLLGVFGALALLLAAIGIYGVLSFSISRRTREMGIRLALGADVRDVFALVVRDGMLLVGAGILIGLAGGLAGARSVGRFLYGVSTSDPVTLVSTTAILAAVALLACSVPARRAMRVNPIETLRYD